LIFALAYVILSFAPAVEHNLYSNTETVEKVFMKKILFVTGALLLLNSIVLFFIANFHIGLILQAVVSAALLLYAWLFEKIKRIMHIIIGVACLLPLLFIFALAVYGNVDNTDYTEDVVIVLGAGIHGEKVSAKLANRLDKAVAYFSKNPEAVIIVCGGQGPQEDITEALAMERYLIDKGVPLNCILKEGESTSTYENFVFSKKILDEFFPQGFSGVVVTNGFHIYRAVKTAGYAGLFVKHAGAHTEWYTAPSDYLREMLAVVKMAVLPPV